LIEIFIVKNEIMVNKVNFFEWLELNAPSSIWLIILFLIPAAIMSIHAAIVASINVDNLWTAVLWILLYPVIVGLGKIKMWKP